MKNVFNVADYGAKPDVKYLQTEIFQKTIEECRKAGGGEIIVPGGDYWIGSLRLYSDMTLHLQEGAHLLGSRDYRNYEDFKVPSTLGYLKDPYYVKLWNLPPYYIYGMICAFGEQNISIIGEKDSSLDGNDCRDENGEEHFRGPMGIIFSNCQNIVLRGYTFLNSANWSHQMDSCIGIEISDIKILGGHDGFNLHHCDEIRVTDCHLETGDDCFAGYDVQGLSVRNSYINTACNALRLGGTNLVFDNCMFEGPGHYPHISENTYHTHALFKYYAIRPDQIRKEGGGIVIQNSEIKGIDRLFSYDYGKEELMQSQKPLRDITLKNCRISNLKTPGKFYGNGERCRLQMQNIECNLNAEQVLLETDSYIELNLEEVHCTKPVKIKAGKQIYQHNCTNVEVIQEGKSETL